MARKQDYRRTEVVVGRKDLAREQRAIESISQLELEGRRIVQEKGLTSSFEVSTTSALSVPTITAAK